MHTLYTQKAKIGIPIFNYFHFIVLNTMPIFVYNNVIRFVWEVLFMYLGYTKSRISMALVFLFSIVLCVLVCIRDRALPIYIPILACVLLLAIGVLTARLMANLIATAETTKLLGILHMELDPETFVRKYKDVPNRIPEKSRDRRIASFYLSDGYAAMGDYESSVNVLQSPADEQKTDYPLKGAYYTALIRGELGMNDFESAEQHLATLDRLIIQSPGKDLAKHMRANHRLYTALLAVMKGETIDVKLLKQDFEKSEYEIRRLELLKIFALNDKNRHAVNSEKDHLNKLAEHGGKTVYAAYARERLEEIGK